MPSNPVDEARLNTLRQTVGEIVSDPESTQEMVEDALVDFIEDEREAIREQERSRYVGLLVAARDVKTFYHDGDEVGGYDGQDIIDNLVEALRPLTPSAPAEKEG